INPLDPEPTAQKLNELDGVTLELRDRHLGGLASGPVRIARAALTPMHDEEVSLELPSEQPRLVHERPARPPMQKQQHRTSGVFAADEYGLRTPSQNHFLER